MANYELSSFVSNTNFDDIFDDNFSHINSIKPITQDPNVFPSTSLLDAVRFLFDNIIDGGSHATLTVVQEDTFKTIENLKVCPKSMFESLHKYMRKYFDIDLYIIAYNNGKFSIINQENQSELPKAYMLFNKDNTVNGPLYTVSVNGSRKTVFSAKNVDIHFDMSAYVIQLNNINSTSEPFYSMEEEQDANSIHEPIQISSMDTTSNFTDEKQLSNLTQIDVKAESHFLLKQLTDNILGLARRLSIDAQAVYEACQPFLSNINLSHLSSDEEIIAAFEVGTTCFSKLLGTVKHSMTVERIDLSQLTLTNHINHQTRGSNRTNIKPMPKHDSIHCDAPSPTKPLKSTHHPRYLKEFTATISAPVRCINSGQRDSIEIKIPLIDCNNPLYLVIELQDLNEQSHCSKVVVPEQTRATNEILINNNDLKCLRFDRCPPNYEYDLETRRIYSKITREERQHLKKEIKIHIINLYQTNGINQALVRDQQLKEFKLVLYLCMVEDTICKRVSKMFHANIMEKVAEKKPVAKRPRRITEKRARKSAKKVTKQLIDVH